jgi:hypothetical protein
MVSVPRRYHFGAVRIDVLGLSHYFKILRSVVPDIAVLMVNDFSWQQGSPEHLFGNYPMLVALSTFTVSPYAQSSVAKLIACIHAAAACLLFGRDKTGVVT